MPKILVPGGAGYIGSITAEVLADAGYIPIIFDNLEAGHREAVADFDFYQGDLRNLDEIDKVIKEVKPDAVVHFAAYLNVGESMAQPLKYFENNVVGSLNLFKAMLKHGVKKLVFSSTCATYGQPEKLPVTESEKERPESPYGESKLIVEHMLEWLQKAGELSSIRLRYFNVAGALPDGSMGEDKDPFMTIVPIAIQAASGQRSFTMNGDDFSTKDGTCVRDYIHVVDLARAHVDALKKLENFAGTAHYNVGVGQGYSNREVVDTVKKVSGVDFGVKIGPRRPGDPAQIYADNTKIRTELGWEPQYQLSDIVKSAWRWHSTHPKGY